MSNRPSINNTAFTIPHVPVATDERKQNYANLREYMLRVLPEFNTNFVYLDSLGKIDQNLYNEFPFLKDLTRVQHDFLHFAHGVLTTDGQMTTNAVYPRFAGEIGLYLSGYRALKNFLASKYEYLLWIEDDNIANYYLDQNLPLYFSKIDFDFDFISVGVRHYHFNIYDPSIFDFGHDIFCKIYQPMGGDALLFSRQGAENVIKLIDEYKLVYPWDWLLLNIRSDNYPVPELAAYALKPHFPQLFYSEEEISVMSTIMSHDNDLKDEDFLEK